MQNPSLSLEQLLVLLKERVGPEGRRQSMRGIHPIGEAGAKFCVMEATSHEGADHAGKA